LILRYLTRPITSQRNRQINSLILLRQRKRHFRRMTRYLHLMCHILRPRLRPRRRLLLNHSRKIITTLLRRPQILMRRMRRPHIIPQLELLALPRALLASRLLLLDFHDTIDRIVGHW